MGSTRWPQTLSQAGAQRLLHFQQHCVAQTSQDHSSLVRSLLARAYSALVGWKHPQTLPTSRGVSLNQTAPSLVAQLHRLGGAPYCAAHRPTLPQFPFLQQQHNTQQLRSPPLATIHRAHRRLGFTTVHLAGRTSRSVTLHTVELCWQYVLATFGTAAASFHSQLSRGKCGTQCVTTNICPAMQIRMLMSLQELVKNLIWEYAIQCAVHFAPGNLRCGLWMCVNHWLPSNNKDRWWCNRKQFCWTSSLYNTTQSYIELLWSGELVGRILDLGSWSYWAGSRRTRWLVTTTQSNQTEWAADVNKKYSLQSRRNT